MTPRSAYIAIATILALAALGIGLKAQQVSGPPKDSALTCAYNATPPTIAPGNFAYVQCDSTGHLATTGTSLPAPIASGGQWYPAFANIQTAPIAAAPPANTARCTPFNWQWTAHVDKASLQVTVVGTGPLNFAIYTDAIDATTNRHQPQTLLTDPSLAFPLTAVSGQVQLALGTPGVGIPLQKGLNWICTNDATASDAARYSAMFGGLTYASGLIGTNNAPFAATGNPLMALTFAITAGTTTANWPSFAGTVFTDANTPPNASIALEIATVP